MKKVQRKYFEKVDKFVPYLRFIPGVRMVAVCNNLAFGRANKDSDIDLFIITKKYHLYTVRFMAVLLFQILGVRRYGKNVSGRFCLSFFIDERHLNLEDIAIERDYYLAFWIMRLIPIIDDGVALNFWRENAWIATFFADKKYNVNLSKAIYKPIGMYFPFFEPFLKLIQRPKIFLTNRKNLKLNKTRGVLVKKDMLKFHEIDRRALYRDKWVEKYGFAKIKKDFFTF